MSKLIEHPSQHIDKLGTLIDETLAASEQNRLGLLYARG